MVTATRGQAITTDVLTDRSLDIKFVRKDDD